MSLKWVSLEFHPLSCTLQVHHSCRVWCVCHDWFCCCSPVAVDVDIVAEAGESIVASCIAIGSPAPTITWSLHSHTTHLEPTNTTQSITTPAEGAIHTGQFVESGVGAVYSSLFLCPSHPGLLTTSLISCTASNGVSGDNSTSHSSFLVNVTGRNYTLVCIHSHTLICSIKSVYHDE